MALLECEVNERFERLKGINRQIAELQARRNNLVIETMIQLRLDNYRQFEARYLEWSKVHTHIEV